MIRIRFHGRGGHGVKTASRIVGTAAFLAGFEVQDSPVYGAERRGAAVTAFTRISETPIRERGMIALPDLIVVADETLLDDPVAGVLAGQHTAAAVFANATNGEALTGKHGIGISVQSFDVTGKSRDVLGRPSALSAGIAGAAARLAGCISREQLQQAVREEFAHLSVPSDVVEKNVAIASAVYDALTAAEFTSVNQQQTATMADVPYVDPVLGASTVYNSGNAEQRHTGAWRVERPVVDTEVCTRCGLCFVDCPDGAITLDAGGLPIIDYDHCKGCMICSHVCPVEAITHQAETAAW
ncbi:MAG: 2-oxoacid:acceptor oxidoreductase family protein [Planctomycetota bacterium]